MPNITMETAHNVGIACSSLLIKYLVICYNLSTGVWVHITGVNAVMK